ncbi:MAG TPA: SIS domain-containing protein [Caulobacteraceae bacterium]|nr:SIS domain-containing protein [Caulobacteraceae bacterium]
MGRPTGAAEIDAASQMAAEAGESPEVIARQLGRNAAVAAEIGRRLRQARPRALLTLARGSSDNAATYARYLIETRCGVITASAPPSVSSVYQSALDLKGAVLIAFSQSGRSPDLIAAAERARAEGALVITLVNVDGSPLAEAADFAIPLHAGAERSVAATKSFAASLAAAAQLTAHWAEDGRILAALAVLPEAAGRALALDWPELVAALVDIRSLYVIGRGVGLAAAQEAALKLKELCGLHAEALSAAELRHGPIALVGRGFPVLAFVQDDESRSGVEAAAEACAAQGAQVFQAGGEPRRGVIGLETAWAPAELQPIVQTLTFYRMAEALARARGFDPDQPPHLAKVTRTL